jgi:hypothetical protein
MKRSWTRGLETCIFIVSQRRKGRYINQNWVQRLRQCYRQPTTKEAASHGHSIREREYKCRWGYRSNSRSLIIQELHYGTLGCALINCCAICQTELQKPASQPGNLLLLLSRFSSLYPCRVCSPLPISLCNFHKAGRLSSQSLSWRRLLCSKSTLRADMIWNMLVTSDSHRRANLTITIEFLVILD